MIPLHPVGTEVCLCHSLEITTHIHAFKFYAKVNERNERRNMIANVFLTTIFAVAVQCLFSEDAIGNWRV